MNTFIRLTLLAWLIAGYSASHAGGGAKEEPPPPGAIYSNLYPAFVVNIFGDGRLRFLKVDITLRFENSTDVDQVRHHTPLIRHELITLLSNQNEESLTDTAKKEELRLNCLKKVQEVLTAKDGRHGVRDLLFQNFVVQR